MRGKRKKMAFSTVSNPILGHPPFDFFAGCHSPPSSDWVVRIARFKLGGHKSRNTLSKVSS